MYNIFHACDIAQQRTRVRKHVRIRLKRRISVRIAHDDHNARQDLVKVFESRRIDDLPVCDAKGRVVGLVDIQDLPKMKVL